MEPLRLEELQLAARNHGMPLEALRYPLTPVGLHYLLIHYDIPAVELVDWRLRVGGKVERPLALSLEDLRARPAMEVTATMECAGNGRAWLTPRAFSQPWLDEAVGTARWRGTPLRPLLEECGVDDDAVEVVFTGLDRGIENGVSRISSAAFCSPMRSARGCSSHTRSTASPSHPSTASAAPRRAGVVRDDEREMALGHHGHGQALRGHAATHGVPAARGGV